MRDIKGRSRKLYWLCMRNTFGTATRVRFALTGGDAVLPQQWPAAVQDRGAISWGMVGEYEARLRHENLY